MIHVLPQNDEREHLLSEFCWCEPRNDAGVMVHNAADCREISERVTGESVAKELQWEIIQT